MPSASVPVCKKFPGNYRELERIATFVLGHARKLPFNSKQLYAIELSVDEACSNIIDHAYHGEGVGEIFVSLELREASIVIVLEDHGCRFDPGEVGEPDLTSPLQARRERGLGVYTIHRLMDEVRFDFSKPGVNRLQMIKQL